MLVSEGRVAFGDVYAAARIVASLARPEGNLDRPPNGNFDHRVSVTCLTPPDGDSI